MPKKNRSRTNSPTPHTNDETWSAQLCRVARIDPEKLGHDTVQHYTNAINNIVAHKDNVSSDTVRAWLNGEVIPANLATHNALLNVLGIPEHSQEEYGRSTELLEEKPGATLARAKIELMDEHSKLIEKYQNIAEPGRHVGDTTHIGTERQEKKTGCYVV